MILTSFLYAVMQTIAYCKTANAFRCVGEAPEPVSRWTRSLNESVLTNCETLNVIFFLSLPLVRSIFGNADARHDEQEL